MLCRNDAVHRAAHTAFQHGTCSKLLDVHADAGLDRGDELRYDFTYRSRRPSCPPVLYSARGLRCAGSSWQCSLRDRGSLVSVVLGIVQRMHLRLGPQASAYVENAVHVACMCTRALVCACERVCVCRTLVWVCMRMHGYTRVSAKRVGECVSSCCWLGCPVVSGQIPCHMRRLRRAATRRITRTRSHAYA